MLKVYGVTYDHAGNYGSFAQSYALSKAISKISIQGEKCDYRIIPVANFPFRRISMPYSKLPRFVKKLLRYFVELLIHSHFSQFNKKYMKYADCKDEVQLADLSRTADAFVCGSDVVWNLYFNWGNPIYFLGFTEKYKFSYAASFGGMKYSDKADEMYRLYLPRFRSIGVREKSAVDIVRKYAKDVPTEVNVDPVLLLNREEWERVIPADRETRKYILAYNTHITPNYTRMIERIKQQTGLPVINVTCSLTMIIKQGAFRVPSPERWLQLIRDAEYIVTNSFHGTAFSVLFNKTFFTTTEGTGKAFGYNVRIYDFLDMLGLSDRVCNAVPEQLDLSCPDFSKANETLLTLREESMQFLQKNIEAAWREKQRLEQKGQ